MRFKMVSQPWALLLAVVVSIATQNSFGKTIKAEWAVVQSLEVGKKIRIRLYDDEVPGGSQSFRGSLSTVSADNVTVVLSDGVTRTFARQVVQRISVRRPFLKNPAPWIVTGMTAGLVQLLIYFMPDLTLWNADQGSYTAGTARGQAFITLPVWAVSSLAMRWKTVYNIPLKHRDAARDVASRAGGKNSANLAGND